MAYFTQDGMTYIVEGNRVYVYMDRHHGYYRLGPR